MGTSPDRIRADIEATRAKLADDLDQLADRTSPRRMAHRRGEQLKESTSGLRDRVMGTRDRVVDSASGGVQQAKGQARGRGQRAAESSRGTAQSAREAAAHAGQSAGEAPGRAAERTRGNPLAAGAIAFGAGVAAASMLPSSQAEEQAAGQLSERAGPVKEAAMESAQHLRRDSTEAARQAARNVKDSTTGQGGQGAP
jgi:uncharacterized protein YjbJ (UPF0337 family)